MDLSRMTDRAWSYMMPICLIGCLIVIFTAFWPVLLIVSGIVMFCVAVTFLALWRK
jgi:hypothetical protein